MRRQIAIVPLDVEEALSIDIATICEQNDIALGCSGTPVPENLGAQLPFMVIERTGGIRESKVVDKHYVSFDVYAKTWKKATDAANLAAGIVAGLTDSDVEVDWHEVDITTLSYNNPDPNHADIPRVTFAAQITTRAATR